ncbi:MAG: suppressor of fused domain protein [Verrucomicrobia bacterium]|nr:suppressor of fused domain protein [Verrucomicrobiota bacterium]
MGAPTNNKQVLRDYRLALYQEHLGTVGLEFADERNGSDETDRIDVLGFERDFIESCEPGSDLGYVLLTNGMSNRRMNVPTDVDPDTPRRAELIWYVRKPTSQIVTMLRWLAELPFLDNTWFNFGLRVPMPEPPIAGCEFRTFLFLIPIIRRDQELAEALRIENDPVTLLTVHLISEAEYQLIRANGLDPLLDLFDEHNYPPIFDPDRPSYI